MDAASKFIWNKCVPINVYGQPKQSTQCQCFAVQ